MADRRHYRIAWVAWAALGLHVVWLAVFGYVIFMGPSGRVVDFTAYRMWLPRCDACDGAADSIRTASEMGRLDLLAIALTVLGVVLALAAIGGFLNIRSAAMHAASIEAGDRVPDIVARELRDETVARALENNPDALKSAVREVIRDIRQSELSEDSADEIASAFDGENDAASQRGS